MQNKMRRLLSGVAGASVLLSGCAQQNAPVKDTSPADGAVPVQEEASVQNEYGVNAEETENSETYQSVKNIQGSFSFNQNVRTPADDVFNLFGTVLTGMCAKPAFETANKAPDYYVNIKGKLTKDYSVNLKEQAPERRILLCACATGPATANAEMTGVKIADLISLAELDEGVNTVTVRGADGYGLALPLSYVLEKEAMIVYQVNGQNLPSGTQFFIPETVAKYFTRDVVDIELSSSDELPAVDEREEAYRAEVAIMNYADELAFPLGDEISFEGYADDCGDAIVAVEFSLDGGETWTAYETKGATKDRWVYWNFAFTPKDQGSYKLSVRAKTASGNVSPLAANVLFDVCG